MREFEPSNPFFNNEPPEYIPVEPSPPDAPVQPDAPLQPEAPVQPDAPLRKGPYAPFIMAKKYAELTGNGLFNLDPVADAEAKTASKSTVHEPFYRGPPEKESCGPMHQTQGISNHAFQNERKKLRKVDVDDSAWLENVNKVRKEAEKASKPDPAFKKLTSKIKELDKDIKTNAMMIQNAKNQPHMASQVTGLQGSIDLLREQKKAIVDSPAYGVKARLIRGAKIMAEKTKGYLTDGSKLPRGEAEHLFIQAISLYGALYRGVEHGGLQLSNSDCMDTLMKMDQITAFTSAAYSTPAPAESAQDLEAREEKNLRVGRAMTQLTYLASPLYKLACLIKSQNKLGPSEIAAMTLALCTLWIAWILNFPDQHFFPKLHTTYLLTCSFLRSCSK